ncbi:MAG TPA: TlpA disulfide reductase family protein, partial [Ferruginibacter sp.]|nr:TlpA disulfide reductase family protein [Ferruginibacter sp.]
LNDSTELQQFEDGQVLKVSYRLNGAPISLKDKTKLLEQDVYLKQEFNILNRGNEVVGEINIIGDERTIPAAKEETVVHTPTIDIFNDPVGKPFPQFAWTDIHGNKLSREGLEGKTVVLNFWYTTCGPCIAEIPLLNELVAAYAGKKVVFIAAAWNSQEQLVKFFQKYPFRYQQAASIDPTRIFSPMPGWPIHIVLDGNGIIRFAVLGKQPGIEQKIAKVIDASLNDSKLP